ncbi:MAG: tRNA (N(6)-L-threonylcarbamoyladenosine(37)-C(2))-methylthiotransferase MtaB [Spirochaetae bacterium HGW-Spirochaetae-7]|nr:MAG: tRNA (N(6)-L-threonylcarbamoyladenosine(37)-C(2))-methylthiotransferase MtaB [Spirochaetae bacterium HGW-Spirochaetae-7]
MTLRASFRTFGCKLNQAETESIADSFAAAGAAVVRAGESADVVVFNTCTVTSKAEQKARREMRLALRLNPEAVALVTGCYAELEPDALAAVAPRTVVIPGSHKDALRGMAAGLVSARLAGLDLLSEARHLASLAAGKSPDPFAFVPGDARFHSRVQLKVQDGCDKRCSYCRVCLARGHSVSLAPGEALARAAALESSGIREVVLTGVNLSQYRSGGRGFPGLLELLVGGTERLAFRVSSWEPDRVDDAFVRAFTLPRVRPHLHLSVQSGSDRVLAAMGRPYGRDAVLRAAKAARAVRDDPFIGADIILGFPGESDDDFRDTLDLLERLEPAWVHAFTFSPRPGTPAFDMKPRVPERVAVERAAIVQAIAERGRTAFASSRLGRVLEAVIEDHGEAGVLDSLRGRQPAFRRQSGSDG